MAASTTHLADAGERNSVNGNGVRRAARDMPEEDTSSGLAEVFGALSNQTRLKIVHVLSQTELCVCDLATQLDMTGSAVSQQLRLLRTMRMVRRRQEGEPIYYALDDQHIEQLLGAALVHLRE